MNAHKNARTTAFGRAVMIRRVLEEGWSVRAVAPSFEVSTRTVRSGWFAAKPGSPSSLKAFQAVGL
jgi:hypothetical protein